VAGYERARPPHQVTPHGVRSGVQAQAGSSYGFPLRMTQTRRSLACGAGTHGHKGSLVLIHRARLHMLLYIHEHKKNKPPEAWEASDALS
jgi:hypothetical protein